MKNTSVEISASEFSLINLGLKGVARVKAPAVSAVDYDQQPRMCAHDAFLTASGGDFGFVDREPGKKRSW